MNCLFCKIVAGDIPADIVYQDDKVLAFRDITPQAPVHLLIIPKKHIAALSELEDQDTELVGYVTKVATQLAAAEGLADEGYRVVMNCNQAGGQTVFHLHMHLLGGRQMHWPPG